MDNYKNQKMNYNINKELKNLPRPPPRENIFNFNKNPFLSKIDFKKEFQKNTQKKNDINKNILSPSQQQKNNINQTKTIKGNVIKETILFNVPNKGKGRSLEKVPPTKSNQTKNLYKNYLDININKKKHGIKNVYPNEKNKERNNSTGKRNKNYEDNRKKDNYMNYNIIKKNINEINNEPEKEDFNKYNSVCVSINNNYNYNLSLGNNNPNNEKIKEKSETWQEKFNRVNKQKENITYLDYKKLTETEFFKNKLAKKRIEKEEENNILNKSENNGNFKQKIKELNSAPPPLLQTKNHKIETKKEINENLNINNEIKNAPKKKTGILGFLQAFKDFLEPINLRKKNSTKNTNEKNNINNNININNINVNNNSVNNNNKINVNLKIREKPVINIPTTPRINNNYEDNNDKYNINSVKITPKVNLYERKNIINKNENYNYYSDDNYDSCPVSNKSYTYFPKKMNNINDKNDEQILNYSQKNIFKNNNNNVYIKGRTDLNIPNNKKDNYNNKTEVEQKEIGFFKFFGFGKNKVNKVPDNNINNNININNNNIINNSINNNNNLIKNFYKEEKIMPYQNPNYSTTYIKKPKRINSPPHKNTYDKNDRRFSYNQIEPNSNNNIFVNYLNDLNNQKENRNKPIIKQKLLQKFNDDYNDDNIEENLNINAEKKIQEIRINIRQQQKEDYNNNNYSFNKGSRPYIKNPNENIDTNKINNSAIYINKKSYNTLDDLIINPKPQKKIETCVINFNKNSNTNNKIYNTPKTNYNKNRFEENYNDNNNYNYNNYNNSKYNTDYNNNNIYSKPYDLSQSQRNLTHNININNIRYNNNNDIDSDNQSTNSAYTTKPMRKKIAINKSERQFRINKTSNNQDDTDSESNSEFSEISQTSIKSVKPTNTIYFKHFKSFFNKNKNESGKGITNNFLKKIFGRDNKKYDTDNSFNSERSNNSNISENNKLAINNVTPLPSDEYYNNNYIRIIKQKVSNKKLYFYQKIYNYNMPIPKDIKDGYYFTRKNLKIIKLPKKKASIYTKYYYKVLQKPKIKQNYIDKKRISNKNGINLPIFNNNCFFTKKNVFININENVDSFDINNENININEEIKINNKNYFIPQSPEKKDKIIENDNNLTYSPQFGTKREPSSVSESPVLNPSKSARDINKIISIEIDLNNNNNDKINQQTPNRNINNGKINQSEGLYIKKKPNMKKLKDDNKCKTYIKNNKKIYDNFNMNINEFNIDSENKEPIKKENKIITIDINLKKDKNNIKNKINNIKINTNDNINCKIKSILEQISDKKNNIKAIVNELFIIITRKNSENNNQIRLPFMDILSNENIFAKIIVNKSLEENLQENILSFAIICQQLCFKLNEDINLNSKNIYQTDEDLKTILAEECKLKIENILNNNYTMNENCLIGIIIFISDLIEIKMLSIELGFYLYENLYKKYKISNMNKYYYLDMIITLLNKIGKYAVQEKYFFEINNFIEVEMINLVNNDKNLPLFMRNKIIELIKIKKYQWIINK